MKLNQKNWSCPKKQNARSETIINIYRSNFSNHIPKHKQYWTMCGQCSTPEGEQLEGSEPCQMLKEGLITPRQFRGVEINPDIHTLNVKAFPNLQWINDDFYKAMTRAYAANKFNPAIVNADFPATPDGSDSYVSRILSFLTDTTEEVMVVVNLILRMKYYTTKDGNYVMDKLNECKQFQYAMTKGNWKFSGQCYEYNGAGNTGSRTYMGSLIFVRRS